MAAGSLIYIMSDASSKINLERCICAGVLHGAAAEVLSDVVKLVELIWLGQQITRVGHRQLQVNAPGIPTAELVVMHDLIDNAPTTITAIALRTGYAQSRVSAAVASMAGRAWVQTEADPSDGRRTVVVIPEQTRADARAYQKVAESRLINALLDGVPDHRRPALMQALEELLVAFREQAERPSGANLMRSAPR